MNENDFLPTVEISPAKPLFFCFCARSDKWLGRRIFNLFYYSNFAFSVFSITNAEILSF